MSKKSIIEIPSGSNVLIKFTDEYTITPKSVINVPVKYRAFVYIDNRSVDKIDPCKKYSIFGKFGKECVGKTVRVAYVYRCNLKIVEWNIERTTVISKDGEYTVSASGVCKASITDYPRIISAFPQEAVITEDDIQGKLRLAVTNVCPKLIVGAIDEGVSEKDAKALGESVKQTLTEESFFSSLGMKVLDFEITETEINLNIKV